jgi:hypothetical protein
MRNRALEKNWRVQMEKTEIQAIVDSLLLSFKVEFVPFSKSRNADQDPEGVTPSKRSLNWKVTLYRNGREIIRTDYSAGIGHCPGYKQNARWVKAYHDIIEYETENGHAAKVHSWGIVKGKAILPDNLDVLYSLVSEARTIDYATYEEWASDYGYNPDSRSGEALYRACLEIALKMRSGIGEAGLAQLSTAFEDY